MMESKLSQSRWTALFWIFPVLFLIDDVLGLNGYQFTVHGIGIRILLFCLSAASLGLYCVWAIVRSRMTIFRRKTGQPFFWDYWRTLDWFVLGFLVLNAVWATVIPVLVRGNMTYGVKDFTTLLVLVLYFPCVFLIRLGLLQEKKLMRWLYPLLVLLDTPAEILEEAYSYIIIIDVGVLVMFAYNLCAGLLRAIGNSFMPLIFLLISSGLNVALDLVFIAAVGMGVKGAAVATVISQGVSVVLCIFYVLRKTRVLVPERKHFQVGRKLYWDLFSQSISMGLMSSIVSAGSVVLQYGINGLGTLVIAGHTAARKMFAFTDMPLIAMANAGSTFVSQNYGANHPDRVRKGMREIYLYSVVVAVLAVLLMNVGAEWMIKLISGSGEAVVLENGAKYLIWNAPFYAVLGVLLSTRYALQSLGQKVLPLFSSVIEFVGKILFVLLFIPRFAYDAVILCEPIIWCFMTIELVWVYLHDPFVFPKKAKN